MFHLLPYLQRMLRPLAIIAAFAILAFLPASATTVIAPDFKTMVHRAEVIFRGRVTEVRSQWEGTGAHRCIVSYVSFDVLKAIKGSPGNPYVLKMLGGTVGDRALEVDGAPKFAVGDVNLLFVEHNGTQFVPLVGIMHGYFRVAADAKTGDETMLKFDGQALRGTEDIDREHQAAIAATAAASPSGSASGSAMKRSDFEAAIQREAKASP